MRTDIVVDIETLGNKTDSTIIQLSAVKFDIVTGEILSEFNEFIDILNITDLKVTGSTLKWWLNTDATLLKEIINKGFRYEDDVIRLFYNWMNADINTYLYGNGILFDNKIVQYKMEQYNLKYPIFYRNDRDMRTLVELYCHKHKLDIQEFVKSFNSDKYIEHNGIDDCRKQVEIIVHCYNDLTI